MKKTIINAKDAHCYNCGEIWQVAIEYGQAVCAVCRKAGYLRDPRGKAFEPIYGPERTYRASLYTPEMPDRRVNERPWPLIRERRMNGVTA